MEDYKYLDPNCLRRKANIISDAPDEKLELPPDLLILLDLPKSVSVDEEPQLGNSITRLS